MPTLDLQTAKGVMKFEFRTAAEMHDWWVDLVHIQHNCKMIHYEKTGAPCVSYRRAAAAAKRSAPDHGGASLVAGAGGE